MKLESIKNSPNMNNCYKCPKASRPALAKENVTPSVICEIFDDARWKNYVKKPLDPNAQ